MAKYIQILVLVAASLLASLRAEAQTDGGVTILAPPTAGIRIGPGLEIILPPTRPPVVVPPPVTPSPVPVALRPPPLPPVVAVRQPPVIPPPTPMVVARTQPQPAPTPAPDLRRPPPPPSVGGLEFFVPEGGARNQVIAMVIGHLGAVTAWADSGPGTPSIPLFRREDSGTPNGEDVTVSLNVSAISTQQVRIRIMCGGGERGGRMLAPQWVRTGTYWAVPLSQCF